MEITSSCRWDSDPSTQKDRNRRENKGKLGRRQSYRLKQKMFKSKIKRQTADRSYINTICVTRTVEWPATQRIGEEKSKLLFMLAINLNPKPGATQNLPSIKILRLDTSIESNARDKTRSRMFELFEKLAFTELCHGVSQFLLNAPAGITIQTSVEIVNLVSDDDDEGDRNAKSVTQAEPLARIKRQRGAHKTRTCFTCLNSLGNYTSSNHCYRKR